MRCQVGGALKVDATKQENKINAPGSGIVVGYQALPMLGLHADYGGRIAGNDGSKFRMFKMTAVLSYVNMKKLKAKMAQKKKVE